MRYTITINHEDRTMDVRQALSDIGAVITSQTGAELEVEMDPEAAEEVRSTLGSSCSVKAMA